MGPGEINVGREVPGISVINISGEHDLSTAPDLREKLASAIAGGHSIVVDLSAAEFIDSSILSALLDARHEAHEDGLGFAVALSSGAKPVARVLDVTGLSSKFPVHATRADAIAAANTDSAEV